MLLCVAGTILICYADGFGSASVLGVVLVLLSAVGAALYKVYTIYTCFYFILQAVPIIC